MNIYSPKGKAREYSPFALNYFNGCDHGCDYCYVPKMMRRFNPEYNHADVSCDLTGLEEAVARFARSEKRDEQILLSFTGDPYCNAENGETRRVLQELLKHQLHVSVLTKNPEKALRDLDIMKQFEHFQLGTTLTFLDDGASWHEEPNAPTSTERMEALKEFSAQGIRTWASFEPVICTESTLKMLEMVAPFIHHVRIGKLNNDWRESMIDWAKFGAEAINICRDRNMLFYIKDDLAKYIDNIYPEQRDCDRYNV